MHLAVTFWDGDFNRNVIISKLEVNGGPYVMEVNSAGGTVPCDNVVAKNLTLNNGGIHRYEVNVCGGVVV